MKSAMTAFTPIISKTGRRHTALVIDDHAFMREIVRQILRDVGFSEIFVAADGTAALELLAGFAEMVDLIVCDVDMEPMNGLDFLARLRSHRLLHLRSLPVVMLTAHSDQMTVLEAKATGTDAYLLKPVSRGNLQERVRFVLERRTRSE